MKLTRRQAIKAAAIGAGAVVAAAVLPVVPEHDSCFMFDSFDGAGVELPTHVCECSWEIVSERITPVGATYCFEPVPSRHKYYVEAFFRNASEIDGKIRISDGFEHRLERS